MKLHIRLQKFDYKGAPYVVMVTKPLADADGQPRLLLADPLTARPIVFADFGKAASLASAVLDANPHALAQARLISPETRGPKGTVWTAAQYAVSVAARQ